MNGAKKGRRRRGDQYQQDFISNKGADGREGGEAEMTGG